MDKKKSFVVSEAKQQTLTVTLNGVSVVFSLFMRGNIGRVDTQEVYQSEEQATARFKAITDKDLKQLLGVFAFCSDFTKQLSQGLQKAKHNGNTKTATKPNRRTYGSNAYGRYRV